MVKMEEDKQINLIINTIHNIDSITRMTTEDIPENTEDLSIFETWCSSDYKEELFSILGHKYYEKIGN